MGGLQPQNMKHQLQEKHSTNLGTSQRANKIDKSIYDNNLILPSKEWLML